ncbi:hypothetical protein FPZ43_11375 [Mucilaginibacter pallidiroseus]|uniref:HTH cro/C1-type domain-containing protein n=1 Tax=Mucilaginibacter pallidiroseus TaxID=2599295 RepID=A0A563UC00_9SPHI|nr:hypothetical protein [Mucilaginibacter pallidiroseus]TWR28864.1 hypothetical protein FPZ43_11375 [Mucilaginibacter pallidiroseus]
MAAKHHGQILEFTLRKNNYNISDLAKSMNVNRRTLYNWFNQEVVKKDIVFRIGCIIRHDFSIQLPELFTENEFSLINMPKVARNISATEDGWRSKYISLLYKYRNLLDEMKKGKKQ